MLHKITYTAVGIMEQHKDTNLSELYSIVEHFMHSYYTKYRQT